MCSVGRRPDDERWMRRCLDLARRGAGFVSPNPMVGAVLVYEGRILGEGYHAARGSAHAEVAAFEAVPPGDRGLISRACLYVNLEPCDHYGRTPPCSLRVLREGVRRVCIGSLDTNPLVGGKGAQRLREAGVEVIAGILEDECRWLNRSFFHFHEKKKPYVILKWAESADGYIGKKGQRVPISGDLMQIETHRWRREVDAILVGSTTAVTDDPLLTDRHHGGPQPLRIIVDTEGQLHPHLRMFQDGLPTWVFADKRPDWWTESDTLHFFEIRGDIFHEIDEALHRAEVQSLLVEGGADTLRRRIERGAWNEARVIRAPIILHGDIPAPGVSGTCKETYKAGRDELRVIEKG